MYKRQAQISTPLEGTETGGSLHDKLARMTPDVLLSVIHSIEKGPATRIRQQEILATYAPKLLRADGKIDWTRPAEAVSYTHLPATVSNSRITTWSYGVEQAQDEVYRVVTATRNNSRGTTCDETQKTLASSLSSTLESKVIPIDPRGNASEQWSEYGPGAVRTQKSSSPTSNVIATATVSDGFTTAQTDHAGVTATHTRAYTETGVIYSSTDGRGNTVTTRCV